MEHITINFACHLWTNLKNCDIEELMSEKIRIFALWIGVNLRVLFPQKSQEKSDCNIKNNLLYSIP